MAYTKPYNIHLGNCLEVLKGMPDNSVDSIVTDPPYGLSFMGKKWDYDVPEKAIWEECLRVLKPGGHLLAFAGTRTQHRMAVRIEDAGFEIRDMIAWVYGSGFPKSMDVSKAIDRRREERHEEALKVTRVIAERAKELGISRRDINIKINGADHAGGSAQTWTTTISTGAHKPGVPTVEQWGRLREFLNLDDADLDAEVWRLNGRKGTPGEAWEKREVIGVQKGVMSGWDVDGSTKFVDRDITLAHTEEAKQWQGWGTALKPALEPITVARKPFKGTVAANVLEWGTGAINIDGCRVATNEILGRPQAEQIFFSGLKNNGYNDNSDKRGGRWPANLIHDGSDEPTEFLGAAARFFYCAKASKKDRGEGNNHPTVKPTDLMAYLCRLVTPPDGVVLDPFMGSGSTGKAAVREGFHFIGIEMDSEYLSIAEARIAHEAGK